MRSRKKFANVGEGVSGEPAAWRGRGSRPPPAPRPCGPPPAPRPPRSPALPGRPRCRRRSAGP
eukprot:11157710-Lingulodinium_polyedra.AAC.1